MNQPAKPILNITARIAIVLLVSAVVPQMVQADIVGPYTPDSKTLFLLHFDEAAGGVSAANAGSKGGNFYSVSEAAASTTPPTVTTMLGAAGYVNGVTNFHNCMTNPTVGYVFGYDFNNSGVYQGDAGGSPNLSADALAMTNLNIGLGGQSPFTIEALIQPSTVVAGVNQEIICTDSSAGTRAFQFRITGLNLQFQFINGGQAISGTIPTTGNDKFVAGNWYHVAITYNGSIATLFWTLLDPTNGAAHVLSTASLTLGTTQGNTTGPLCIGNENRNTAGEQFLGSIDEVCISSVARGAGEMQLYSSKVTITQNPVSQNVDYNQPVTFTVGGSSSAPRQELPLGYQWRFNSNSIAGATNSSYIVTNVAAFNAGYYDCIVTNTLGFAATSSPARLVVGAANFLANRYSFTTDTSDSVGGQWGTNFGNATISGGKLVLDGTTDTYMQLPGNLFNSANATALTVEFWANYGANPNFVYTFAFGVTNFVIGSGIVGFNHAMFCSHTGSGGQTASATPGDPQFAQTANASGTLDGRNVHVAVVFDPPNKSLSIYTNGVLEIANTNFTVNISSLNDQLSYIGKSLWPNDPYLNASIDEIRIFRGALSPITIKQSQDQGPNTLLADGPAKFVTQPASTSVPVGQTATFTAAAVGYLPITYQWFKNGTLVPGETNATYTLTGTLADNNATIQVWATNTIGVTTYVTNSSTATLTVFVPPTLAWLDPAHGGADSSWNTTSANWTNIAGGGPLAFAQTNAVLFDSRGSGSPSVDVAQPTIVYNVKADATTDYTLFSSGLTGSLEGQGSITKVNSGKLIIDLTNNLSGPVTISGGTLQVGNADSYGSLGSGPVTNQAALAFNRSDATLIVPNAIHGSGSVRFDGPGTVTVNGASDYSGSTTVNAGILNLQSAAGLGSTAGGTVVANGAQLYITANVDIGAESLSISGAGDTAGALRKGGAGATAYNGPISLVGDSTIGVDGGATLTLSNTVSGSALLSVNGTGTLALNKPNLYTGGTDINGPILNYNANGAVGRGRVNFSGNGRIVIADGLNFTNAVTASVVSPGTATGLLMVNDNTNGTITTVSGPMQFDATAANGGHFQGPLTSGYLNVTGPITNAVTGTISSRNGFVRFSGGGDYTAFTLSEGTTSIGANNGISPNAAMTIATSGNATFDLNGFNQALTGLIDGGTLTEVITNSSAALSTLTLNLSSVVTFNGTIAGKVALVQNGSGSLFLVGTNAYTGNTTVNGGILEIAQPTFASSSTIAVANGATLQLDFVATNTIAGLVLNGANQPAGEYNTTTSPTFISGSGTLKVVPVVNTPTNLTFSVSGNAITISWPSSHQGWILQAQTNSISTGLSGNWVDVTGSGSVTQQVININPANPSVFFRLRSP